MAKTKIINFEVNEELANIFETALNLTGENQDEVFEKSISNYVRNVFFEEKNEKPMQTKVTSPEQRNEKNEYKAKIRIPRWAFQKKQINHKIIKAFLKLEKENLGSVNILDLENLCLDQSKEETYVKTFNSNFASMKTDAGNSHGKVFEEDYRGFVSVWEPIKSVLDQYRSEFLD